MDGERDWSHSSSDPILLLLYESGVALAPMDIRLNLNESPLMNPPGRNTVFNGLEELREAGFIEQPFEGKSQYQLTNTGIAYTKKHLDPGGRIVDRSYTE